MNINTLFDKIREIHFERYQDVVEKDGKKWYKYSHFFHTIPLELIEMIIKYLRDEFFDRINSETFEFSPIDNFTTDEWIKMLNESRLNYLPNNIDNVGGMSCCTHDFLMPSGSMNFTNVMSENIQSKFRNALRPDYKNIFIHHHNNQIILYPKEQLPKVQFKVVNSNWILN